MNWPEYLISACKNATREPNSKRMSVTRLFDSPLVRTLEIKYWDKIQSKPEDMLWALYGTAVHEIINKHNLTGITDLKLEIPFDDYTIVGKPDIYYPASGLLIDAKTTSIWNLKELKKEWIAQLNCYKYMMSRLFSNFQILKMEIHGLGKDWRWNEKMRYQDYPSCPFVILDVPVWNDIQDIIDTHIKDHALNPERECTPDEKWAKPDQFAVMKKKQKKAVRVLDTEVEAQKYILDKGLDKNHYIEKRPGELVRCDRYCSVSEFCPYYKGDKQ